MTVKLNWDKIIDLLLHAKNNLVLIMPAVHEPWVEVIRRNENKDKLNIHVCFDNSEEVIRNGYGDVSSIADLKELGATVKECDGLRISFICSDQEAYCLFLESRMLAGDPEGYNAVKLNMQTAREIMLQFSPELFSFKQENPAEVIAVPLQEEKAEEIKAALDKNPPEDADLKRKISTYNTLFQYAELHLEGGNLSSKSISIPSDALPFKDEELKKRMKATFNLFTKETTAGWSEIHDLKSKVDEIRKTYLNTCAVRKEKSILKKEDKEAFRKEVDDLKKEIEEKTKTLINKVQTAINNSEDTLRDELRAFFKVNQLDSFKGLDKENTDIQIEKEINKILFKIKLPDANSLISKIKLEVMYYELTYEDLNDEKFLEWFHTKGLITIKDSNKLANFKDAFAVKG